MTLLKVLAGFGENEDLGGGILNYPCTLQMFQRLLSEVRRLFERIGDADVYFPEAGSASSIVSGMVVKTTATADWVDGSPPTVATIAGSVQLLRHGGGDPNVRNGATVLYAVDDSAVKYCTSDYMDDKIGTIKMFDGIGVVPTGWQVYAGTGIIEFASTVWTLLPAVDTDSRFSTGAGQMTGAVSPQVEEFVMVTADINTSTSTDKTGTTPLKSLDTDWQPSFSLGSSTDGTTVSLVEKLANVTLNEDALSAAMTGEIQLAYGGGHTHALDSDGNDLSRSIYEQAFNTEVPTAGGNYNALGQHYHSIDTAANIVLDHTQQELIITEHSHSTGSHVHPLTEPTGPNPGDYGHTHTVNVHTHTITADGHWHIMEKHYHEMTYSPHLHTLGGDSFAGVALEHPHTPGSPATYKVIPIERIH